MDKIALETRAARAVVFGLFVSAVLAAATGFVGITLFGMVFAYRAAGMFGVSLALCVLGILWTKVLTSVFEPPSGTDQQP